MLFFIIGAVAGSFGHVVAYRTLHQLNFTTTRSRCDACARHLHPLELIPVASYLALRGRCRTCTARIAPTIFWLELFCGFSFFFMAYFLPLTQAVFYFGWLLLATLLTLQDFWSQTITLNLLVFGHLFLYTAALLTGQPLHLLTLVVCALLLFSLSILLHQKIGPGDLSLLLIWSPLLTLNQLLWLIILACAVALPFALKNRGRPLPFVPFLTFGAIVALLLA